jgi:hypothetical protein
MRTMGFNCKLKSVVCPVPRLEGVVDPYVTPTILTKESYKYQTTITLLSGFAPIF